MGQMSKMGDMYCMDHKGGKNKLTLKKKGCAMKRQMQADRYYDDGPSLMICAIDGNNFRL